MIISWRTLWTNGPDPSALRREWEGLPSPEQLRQARIWRADSAARGDLESARLFFKWEQEAQKDLSLSTKKGHQEDLNFERTDRQKESSKGGNGIVSSSKTDPFPVPREGELHLQIEKNLPCPLARRTQFLRRLERWGAKTSSFESDISLPQNEEEWIWKGILPPEWHSLKLRLKSALGIKELWVQETAETSKTRL